METIESYRYKEFWNDVCEQLKWMAQDRFPANADFGAAVVSAIENNSLAVKGGYRRQSPPEVVAKKIAAKVWK